MVKLEIMTAATKMPALPIPSGLVLLMPSDVAEDDAEAETEAVAEAEADVDAVEGLLVVVVGAEVAVDEYDQGGRTHVLPVGLVALSTPL
ncbi:hypothetical protein AMS68_007390 [Peltaster fructicola]|uniref:Uncharacterized protein n=1 Tax=Peltaster fructicola TaxID=286661 RepID=A0A6H0Y4F1_9PEZI|nr:hypothetical protein AMS68_007390 [Peltaster fructicola]